MLSRPTVSGLMNLLSIGVAFGAFLQFLALLHGQSAAAIAERCLLPQWDQAAHALEGWDVYAALRAGRIDRAVWELWSQGVWPFLHSLVLVPFYALRGPEFASAIEASRAAFLLVGAAGAFFLARLFPGFFAIPIVAFLAFLSTSRLYAAYSGMAMLEIFGALAALIVFLAGQEYSRRNTASAARFFAISLTALFFTKFNYFFLVAVPILVFEIVRASTGTPFRRTMETALAGTRRALGNKTGKAVLAGLLFFGAVRATGGFDLVLFGHEISVHGVGGGGYVIVYLILWKVWDLHRRGRIDWDALCARDPRIRPLLVYFFVPVAVWFAIPIPNHLRDFVGFLVNRRTEGREGLAGLAYYIDVLAHDYFWNGWVLAISAALFAASVVRFRSRPWAVRLLACTAPIQLAMIFFHPMREERFLFLAPLSIWLVAAYEIGRALSGSPALRAASAVLAAAGALALAATSPSRVRDERFQAMASRNFAAACDLDRAFDRIRRSAGEGARVAFLGKSNTLSPALVQWELGAPAGFPHAIGSVSSRKLEALDGATHVVLAEPDPEHGNEEIQPSYEAFASAVEARQARGELQPLEELNVPSERLRLHLFQKGEGPPPSASMRR
jgi:hypothetical protein